MAFIFKTIGLIGKFGDPSVGETLGLIADYLLERDFRVLFDEESAELIPPNGLEVASRAEMGRLCDLAIVVGGDGTLLNVARSLVDSNVPLLGVNLGRLGFLADVSPDELPHRLEEVLNGQYREETRNLLHAQIIRDGEIIAQSDAVNDVVVHKRDVARMIELETFLNEQFLNDYRADGLIIATPTGSTAYALSGGGPIIHPALSAVVVVPICPHTLTHRPIVVEASSTIEIRLRAHNTTQAQVTCDGQVSLPLEAGDSVIIRQKKCPLRLIHPRGHDYFELLRAKLRWGQTPDGGRGSGER